MSEANGTHAPTLDALREQYRLARAQARLAQARQEAQLWESLGAPGLNMGDLLNPWGFRQDPFGGLWLPLAQGNTASRQDGRNFPHVMTDADLDRQRAGARWLCAKNDLAIGAVKTLRNYTVKKGYDYEAQPAPGHADDARAVSLASQVQRLIDRHSDVNGLKARERSAFTRAVRDGEAFVRHFAQNDGTTLVRFVEAEQVRDPGYLGPCGTFGVETDEYDIETPLAYHVTYDGTAHERVPADEISHLKRNVDECIKRGVSDFFSAGEPFDDVHKLLRNMRRGGALLAAIAWIEQFENTTGAQLSAHQSALKDLARPSGEHPLSGRRVDYQTMDPGTIVRTQKGKTYLPPPLAGNTSNFTGIIQACLRSVGVRWCMPEYMVSGDASNANYSSTLVSGSPFVNAVECEQDDFGLFFLRWRWIAVRNACAAGLIRADFDEVQALVDIHYTPPQVAVANEAEQASIDHQDIAAGVMSIQTRRARRGLDDDHEDKNIAEKPPKGGGQDQQGQGQPPGMPALGESIEWLEEATGRKAGEAWQGPSGRWFTLSQSGRVVPAKAPGGAGGGAAKGAGPMGGHPLEGKTPAEMRAELQKVAHHSVKDANPWSVEPKGEPAVLNAVIDAVAGAKKKNSFASLKMGEAFAAARKAAPSLTVRQFHDAMLKLQKDGRLALNPSTGGVGKISDADVPFVMPLDREVKMFVDFGRSGEPARYEDSPASAGAAKPAKKAPREKPKPADTVAHLKSLAGKTLSPEETKGAIDRLLSHSVAEMNAIKKELGLKASGAKAVLAAKIVEQAKAQAFAKKPPAPTPAKKAYEEGDY